jgi:hypothetical protein
MSATSPREATKSPVNLAKVAMAVGQQGLTPYSCAKSRHDYRQGQLFAILAVRQFLQLDYRGMVVCLAEWSDLREAIELTKVPHYTTLQKAEQRLLKRGLSTACSALFSTLPGIAA